VSPRTGAALAVLLGAGLLAHGQRSLSADAYLDKVHGMWMGQILGNYAGRPSEGHVVRGGEYLDIPWDSILDTAAWQSDDDTCLEYMYLDLLKGTLEPTSAQIRQAWTDNISAGSLYIANRQARWLMEPPPVGASLSPPQTGSLHHNMHFYAIDAQIATESLGALAPGMRQRAAELCGSFASVTNEGYSVHAAQFYAAMYASAAFESDIESVVEAGLAVVPVSSRTHEVIQAVGDQYQTDKLAGNLSDPNAWRAAQTMLYDHYGTDVGSNFRYRYWIESTINVGLTTMAVLYGQGDFVRTVEIGVLGGYDADCNPATAGGLIGMIKGYDASGGGILAELPQEPNDAYDVRGLMSVGALTTVSQVAADFRAAVETQILNAGGTIDGEGAGRIYTIPDEPAPAPIERPDPSGAKGLVGRVQAAGGQVTVSASIERHYSGNDRTDLEAIIDGITDLSYNGHLPYYTYTGADDQPAGGDYYQLNFERPMTFHSVIFYEGDIFWSGINSNPRLVEPRGGYFLNLTVEVLLEGEYREVTGLELSEALDANEYYQAIELTFDPAVGEAIRIRGDAGGEWQFTTIVELEAYGAMGVPGDFDEDGDVDRADLLAFADGFGLAGVGWAGGDSNFDGIVDWRDYLAMKANLGSGGGPIPEPATWLLLVALVPVLRSRRGRPGPAGGRLTTTP